MKGEYIIKPYEYDVECYKNYFCVTFRNTETGQFFVYELFEGEGVTVDDRHKLMKFLDREIILIGFNNERYDGLLLNYFINRYKIDVRNQKFISVQILLNEMYGISQQIISDSDNKVVRQLRYETVKYSQMDLMLIMAFHTIGVSLKQVGITLKWYRIQDLPIAFDQIIKNEDRPKILDYNKNDVLITSALGTAIAPLLALRKDLSKIFGVDLTNASNSKMGNLILESLYPKRSGIALTELRQMRTKYNSIPLANCIGYGIQFRTEQLQKLLTTIKETIVYEGKFGGFSVNYGGLKYKFGKGGLHSDDEPAKFKTDKNYLIRDADVGSFYPTLMINNKIAPKHLGSVFTDLLAWLTQERLSAKDNGNDAKAEGLKTTIVGIFGKLESDTFWLEDAQAFYSVTISGQLYLLMLIERLVMGGIEVISANTDGIVSKIPRHLESEYQRICDEWCNELNFKLEYTDYELYVRRDVNNYITQTPKKIKTKGIFSYELNLMKGYKHPVVAKALYNYFINGISVEDYLNSNTDILDYCLSVKGSGDFEMRLYDNAKNHSTLQKTNRFFVSHKGGRLIKHHKTKHNEIGVVVGSLVTLLNDFDPNTPFRQYNVNLAFYKAEAYKIIDLIEPKTTQGSMF